MRVILLLLIALFCFSPLHAQNRDKLKRERVDSVLSARYYKTPYDTNYVVRPEGKLTLKLRLNQTGNTFHAKGHVDGTKRRCSAASESAAVLIAAISFWMIFTRCLQKWPKSSLSHSIPPRCGAPITTMSST